ncbi:hypothetical protein I4F81_010924 [Pyropia yezoensis]|uniref:Uncharacterized protein n=1 Tax=Pyropia yezoensis TaxID=2788 RepID=A0ACC3CF97_PYRYE|nr:hypothetical protein I4F81_010924 [Neopyropia yezoensis]
MDPRKWFGRPAAKVAPRHLLAYAHYAELSNSVGASGASLTATYHSKKDALTLDGAVAVSPSSRMYASFALADRSLTRIGAETAAVVTPDALPVLADFSYSPARDTVTAKLSARRGPNLATAWLSAANVSGLAGGLRSALNRPASSSTGAAAGEAAKPLSYEQRLEFESRLSDTETLRLQYDVRSRSTRVKLTRVLDKKNRVDAEYSRTSTASQSFVAGYQHKVDSRNKLSASANFGRQVYNVEWENRADGGPWTVKAVLPFAGAPTSLGDFTVRRKFEF